MKKVMRTLILIIVLAIISKAYVAMAVFKYKDYL